MPASGILLITDNCVPRQVNTFLRSRGHTVELSRTELTDRAKDPPIVAYARTKSAVIVTFDKDYMLHATNAMLPQRTAHRNWGLIMLRYPTPRKEHYLREWIELVEFELAACQQRTHDGLILHMEVYMRQVLVFR